MFKECGGYISKMSDTFCFEFVEVADETEILVSNENGRGIALTDLNNDDHLDIICGNWEGNHRIFLQLKAKSVRHFRNVASTFLGIDESCLKLCNIW
jgi:hypothetical protein